jgi:hypothetical protein
MDAMKLQRLMFAAIALFVCTGSKLPRALAACPPDRSFSFQVERPSGAPARNVRLIVEVGGASGTSRQDAVVNETGNVMFCLDKDSSGKMVDVYVPANLKVMYPSRQRLPLTREGSPSIVVCEASRDCAVHSEAEIAALLQKLQAQTRSMTKTQKAEILHELQDWIGQLSRETNANNEKLIRTLYQKERRIKAASQTSTLLRTFVNRARELLERFNRHAERVLQSHSQRELDDMSEAITAYNPIFNEMSERADAYLKETSDYWSSEASSDLRSLIDEALEIHKQGIHPLNGTKLVIIDCIKRRPGPACSNIEAARATVQAARKTTSGVTIPRLNRFDSRVTAWLSSLDDRLFDEHK